MSSTEVLSAALTVTWVFEQLSFIMKNSRSVVESDFYTKLKKFDAHEGKNGRLFADQVTGTISARSCDSVPSPAGARICEVKHRGIIPLRRGRIRRGRILSSAQFSHVWRCNEHKPTEFQSWCHQMKVESD